jgi:hypothetical protein
MNLRRFARIVAIIGYAATSPALLHAASITLNWDAPSTYTDGSPLTGLAGFRIYVRTSTGVYSKPISVGNTNSYTITNLTPKCTYYSAITALSASGIESDYSKELAIYIPPSVIPSTNTVSVSEGAIARFQVKLDVAPVGTVTASVQRASGGNPCLGVTAGAVLVFTPANWNSNQTVTLEALYDAAKTNRTASFRISGEGLRSATVLAVSVGTGTRLLNQTVPGSTGGYAGSDANANGIADDWEIYHVGGLGVKGACAPDDTDGDGVSNLREYVAGTDPLNPQSLPEVRISLQGGTPEVSFVARKAEGIGYSGKNRYYTLAKCTSLRDSGWVSVSSATDIPAIGQTVSYKANPGTPTSFYRVEISLR